MCTQIWNFLIQPFAFTNAELGKIKTFIFFILVCAITSARFKKKLHMGEFCFLEKGKTFNSTNAATNVQLEEYKVFVAAVQFYYCSFCSAYNVLIKTTLEWSTKNIWKKKKFELLKH